MYCIELVCSFINIPHFIHRGNRISRLENELQEAKRTISDLEARNKQNDNDVEMLKRENRSVLVFYVSGLKNSKRNNLPRLA